MKCVNFKVDVTPFRCQHGYCVGQLAIAAVIEVGIQHLSMHDGQSFAHHVNQGLCIAGRDGGAGTINFRLNVDELFFVGIPSTIAATCRTSACSCT